MGVKASSLPDYSSNDDAWPNLVDSSEAPVTTQNPGNTSGCAVLVVETQPPVPVLLQ